MSYGFRLKAIATAKLTGVAEENDDSAPGSLELPPVEGHRCSIRFSTTELGRTIISLVGRGYDSESTAQHAGAAARGALRHAALVTNLAVDFGHEPARGTRLSEAYREAIREKAPGALPIGDAHGLVTWEDDDSLELVVVGMKGSGTVGYKVEPFLSILRESLEGGPRLEGDTVALAADLYFFSDFETSDRASFLTLITSLEVLSRQEPQPPDVSQLVKHFQALAHEAEQATRAEDEETGRAFRSLAGSLGRLRRESIQSALDRLVREGPYAPTDVAGDVDADVELAQDAYNVRSSLVHDGKEPERIDLGALSSDVRLLVARLLRGRAWAGEA